jgi:hypothetical protein
MYNHPLQIAFIVDEIKVWSYFNVAASLVDGSESSIPFEAEMISDILEDFNGKGIHCSQLKNVIRDVREQVPSLSRHQ